VTINGRFLFRRLTGVERYAIEVSRRMNGDVNLIKPKFPLHGLGGHLWEQLVLPRLLDPERVLWSPANTGPISISNQVLTLHDVSTFDHPEWFRSGFSAWYRLLLPRLVHKARQVITVSEFSRNRIVQTFRLDSRNVVSIPEGVDLNHFSPATPEQINRVRQKFKLFGDYLLVVATLEPRKNLVRLLQAWQSIVDRLKDTYLVIAGGTYPVFRPIDPMNHTERVRWLGYIQEEHLPALYSGAKAFILPSLYEGFGLSVLEAMACGTPVIVSSAGALPEVVGKAGSYVDPLNVAMIAETIERVIGDEKLRADCQAHGRERASRFSWDYTSRCIQQVLEEACE
jgi:glycosyltransferase involved in cell wall biosynthesis